jgi:hypothetical protein
VRLEDLEVLEPELVEDRRDELEAPVESHLRRRRPVRRRLWRRRRRCDYFSLRPEMLANIGDAPGSRTLTPGSNFAALRAMGRCGCGRESALSKNPLPPGGTDAPRRPSSSR